MLSPRCLWGQCGVPVPVRVGSLGWTQSLPVPPKGQDGGVVVSPCVSCD
jgi:hypothetical protein